MLMAFALCPGTFAVQNMPLGDMQMITGLQPIFVRQILLGSTFSQPLQFYKTKEMLF
jgi:hypothetical protein